MITAVYAGILAILYIILTLYVVHGRWVYKIGIGNGGNEALARRVRMHGNFAETVPFCVLLLFMVDYAGYSPTVIHSLGIALVIGRIAHALGLRRSSGTTPERGIGMVLTVGMMAICAVLLLWKFFALWTISL